MLDWSQQPTDTAWAILPPTPLLSDQSHTDLISWLVEVDHPQYLSQAAKGILIKSILHDLNIRHTIPHQQSQYNQTFKPNTPTFPSIIQTFLGLSNFINSRVLNR